MFGLSRLLKLAGTRRALPRQQARRVCLAPEELEARLVPTLLGQSLFSADYPWNQNISNAPVAANSAAIISHIGTSIKIHPDWGDDSPSNGSSPLYGIPFSVVHGNTTPTVNVLIDNYPGESDIQPVPIPPNPVIEGDYQNGPNPNGGGYNTGQRGDSHLLIWDEDNNIAYELYGVTRPSDPTLFPNTSGVELSHTDGKWHAAQESVWHMSQESFRPLGYTSADAAGLSILAGLARPDEGRPTAQGGQGAITHALRFTLPSGDVNPQYIYPASHVVSVSSASTHLPFGARLRLVNTPAVNSVISTLGPQAQIIAHAMQQYGLVLADIGSAMYVTGSSASQDANNNIASTWNMSDVLGLAQLTAGNFEVVNLAPVVTGLSVSGGAAGSLVTVTGQNFSGAAGHLSVLFGNTAASTVTFVDDSHLTAVVPAGLGTVHVRVQSGVNATDPNNPNDNVNNPIFGYGISITSAADQFTYGSQTVSGTNSTASFATSTVASGSTDTLTIVVKDTGGNSVTGLAGSAFGLSLSGGTSAGTFGTVSETATPGTYTTAFTGTTAGTASTLTVTVSGVTLATMPTITVNPGAVSGANSTVSFASSTVTSGSTDTVTVVVKDGSGNAISGLASSAFTFSLSGGTSAGTFSAVSATATPGTYTATFTGTTAGTASTLKATVNGVTLATMPTITVTPAGGVTILDNGLPGYSDAGGWLDYSSGYGGSLRYASAGTGSATATWQATGLAAGAYLVQATWNGYPNHATNAPFSIYDGNTLLTTVVVNQQPAPNADATANGFPFQTLTTVTVGSGTLKVVLSNNANGYVVADALRIAPTAAPTIDLSWSGGGLSNVPTTATTSAPITVTRTYTLTNSGSGSVPGFTIGYYASPDGTLANATRIGTETVPAGQAPATYSGSSPPLQFSVAGTYYVLARLDDGGAVPESNEANNLTQSAQPVLVSGATILDNGQPGYADAGGWLDSSPGYGGGLRYASAGTGSATATWQATGLAAGAYLVQATWNGYPNHATNAPFSFYDGNTLLTTVQVNQQPAPTADATAGGFNFQTIATVTVSSGTLKVVLSNNANGYVVADALRIAPTTAPTIDLNWSGGGLSNVPATASTSTPFTVTRTYTLTNTGSGTVPSFTIGYYASPDGTLANATRIGTETVPAGPAAGTYSGSSPTLQFSVAGNYYVLARLDDGGAIAETNEGNNLAQSAQPVAVSGVTILDNGQPGYADAGGWLDYAPGYGGGLRYAAAGTGSATATWQLSGLAAGNYLIQATWNGYYNHASNAPFSIYDGTTLVVTVRVNQQPAPAANATVGGFPFQTLATVTIHSGTLRVVLSNDADGYVVADALRVAPM
jgi:hypothetical protein